jgi:hypothetical protein
MHSACVAKSPSNQNHTSSQKISFSQSSSTSKSTPRCINEPNNTNRGRRGTTSEGPIHRSIHSFIYSSVQYSTRGSGALSSRQPPASWPVYSCTCSQTSELLHSSVPVCRADRSTTSFSLHLRSFSCMYSVWPSSTNHAKQLLWL